MVNCTGAGAGTDTGAGTDMGTGAGAGTDMGMGAGAGAGAGAAAEPTIRSKMIRPLDVNRAFGVKAPVPSTMCVWTFLPNSMPFRDRCIHGVAVAGASIIIAATTE